MSFLPLNDIIGFKLPPRVLRYSVVNKKSASMRRSDSDMSMAIDIHTHIVPASFPAHAGTLPNPRWPLMTSAHDCCHRNVIIDGKVFRTVSNECWEVEQRKEAMARMGIARQVLSPMPELLSYWFDQEDAFAIGRHVNGVIMEMVSAAPDHFVGLGMSPLQNPDLAARELADLMSSGCLNGVEIGTHVNGTPIGDARFEQFFAAAEEVGAAIFVHALHPTGAERIVGSPQLANFVGFPCETAFAVASLMTSGILNRHPGLRIAFSHGGGAFALVLPRLEKGCQIAPDVAAMIGASPTQLARRLYYDSLVYDRATLNFLIESFGESQICVGTDFPFDIQEHDPIGRLNTLSDRHRRLLEYENASRFLFGAT